MSKDTNDDRIRQQQDQRRRDEVRRRESDRKRQDDKRTVEADRRRQNDQKTREQDKRRQEDKRREQQRDVAKRGTDSPQHKREPLKRNDGYNRAERAEAQPRLIVAQDQLSDARPDPLLTELARRDMEMQLQAGPSLQMDGPHEVPPEVRAEQSRLMAEDRAARQAMQAREGVEGVERPMTAQERMQAREEIKERDANEQTIEPQTRVDEDRGRDE